MSSITAKKTFAVVVGISDYQSPKIEDLQFADKDAMAFAEWLKSPAGGEIPEEQIMLLTNLQATRANVISALDWLLEMNHKEYRYIIYFSGHGDVEVKTKYNRGFLLCSDSPPNNYPAAALPVTHIQDVVSTLSDSGKVIVITDACRSGKLAGSSNQGSQTTALEMAKIYSNEIKILSCQPDEFSHEGRQWGTGRGVFSYFLLDGLYGLADANGDAFVTLGELNRYIPEKIEYDISPLSQTPMFLGNMNERLSAVDSSIKQKLLTEISNSKKKTIGFLDLKGLEERVLETVDSLTRAKYVLFKAALQSGHYFEPESNNANTLYDELSKIEKLLPLHSLMRRNFAAGLQNEVQQALNALLEDDPFEFNTWYNNPAKYIHYPRYLERAMELLGEKHPSLNLLQSQLFYFKAYLLKNYHLFKSNNKEDFLKNRMEIKHLYEEALKYNPDAAFLYHGIENLYFDKVIYAFDSIQRYFDFANSLAPQWITPYHDYYDITLNTEVNLEKADSILGKALQVRPESYLVRLMYAWQKQREGKVKAADSTCFALIKERPELHNAWSTMVQTHWEINDWKRVLEYAEKSFLVYPDSINWASVFYYDALIQCNLVDKAKKFRAKFENTSTYYETVIQLSLARYYFERGNYDAGKRELEKLNDQTGILLHLQAEILLLNGIYQLKKFGDKRKAREFFNKAIKLDPTPSYARAISTASLAQLEYEDGNVVRSDSLFRLAMQSGFYWIGKWQAQLLYANCLFTQNRFEEARHYYQTVLNYTDYSWEAHLGMSKLYAMKGSPEKSLHELEMACKNFMPNPGKLWEDPVFKSLRKNKKFKALLLQYKQMNSN